MSNALGIGSGTYCADCYRADIPGRTSGRKILIILGIFQVLWIAYLIVNAIRN